MIALTFRRLLIMLLHLYYITVSLELDQYGQNVIVLDEPLLMCQSINSFFKYKKKQDNCK